MLYSNGSWIGEYADFDYLDTDTEGNTIICNQVDDGECETIGSCIFIGFEEA